MGRWRDAESGDLFGDKKNKKGKRGLLSGITSLSILCVVLLVSLQGTAGAKPISYHLSVSKVGTGTGLVEDTFNSYKINCGTICEDDYNDNQTITLTATADPSSTFMGWTDCPSGDQTTNPCDISAHSLTVDHTVYATFAVNAPYIVATPGSPVSFGSVNVGSSSSAQTFTVGNAGSQPLEIDTIVTDNIDFVISNDLCSGETLAYGESCTLQVTFTPSGYGAASATLDIPSNDPYSVGLDGIGEASNIEVSPDSPVSFGSVNVGSSSSAQLFTVSNTGNIDLDIGTIVSDNPEYDISNDNCSGWSIAPAGGCTLEVTFIPSTYGEASATLDIPSNDPYSSPFSITLNGIGDASNIEVSPASPVDFYSVNVGSPSSAELFTINNTGNIGLEIGTITSSNPDEFEIQNDYCSDQTIDVDSSCTLEVVFWPLASGTRNSTLAIPSNDPDSGYLEVALSGTGLQYLLSVAGASGSATGGVTGATGIDCAIAADGSTTGTCAELINPGETITLTSAPAEGASVTWSGCDSSAGDTCEVTVDADTTVTASFDLNTYTVTGSSGGNGTIDCTSPVDYGLTTTCSLSPDTGYHIVSASGCGGSLTDSTFTTGAITDDCTVDATFAVDTHTVAGSSGGNGTINCTSPVDYESTSTCSLSPASGYHIGGVGGTCPAGTLNGNEYTTGAITDDCTVIATFAVDAPTVHTVTGSSGGNGTIDCTSPVTHGETTTCSLAPDPGFYIESASGCGGSLTDSTFTTGAVTADCTVDATFAPYGVKRAGTTTGYYATVQEAFAAVEAGDEIMLRETSFSGHFDFAADAAVTLAGGYDATFLSRAGYAVLSGSLTISRGTVVVDNIAIQ
jgi:hypothetical protein